jgi:hypothetical protein
MESDQRCHTVFDMALDWDSFDKLVDAAAVADGAVLVVHSLATDRLEAHLSVDIVYSHRTPRLVDKLQLLNRKSNTNDRNLSNHNQ